MIRLASAILSLAAAAAAQTGDIAGVWEITATEFGQTTITGRLTLEVTGEKLTGRAMQNMTVDGTVRAREVKFEVRDGGGRVQGTFTGTVRDGTIEGEATYFGGRSARWTARRAAVRPAGAPRVHDFTPREFHRVFSGAIPPALRIFPGDTVRTETVDAGGVDEKDVRRSLGGNPQTGPFYIEGAMPGDTLVVRLDRVRLNRDSARSGSGIIPSALLPSGARPKPVDNFDSGWRLDRQRGVAVLAKPTERLKNYAVPLGPMLGCVGVAPPRGGVIPTGDSGGFGGNMDYNQVREGTTVYLPVFQPGALLFVGDGHAVQGDGELTGDALETSMDVEFTVDLIRDKSIATPRAEDGEFLMAIGIAGSLDRALQSATSSLARWLETDYKLNSAEVAMVLGTAIRYDVADLVGTQVSIVAKAPKSALATIGKQ